jgi:hypothetical protein
MAEQRSSRQYEEGIMKSDFSGEYVLNREASTLSAAVAESVQKASLLIKHDEPNFSCQGTFSFVNSKSVEWAFELAGGERDATQTEPPSPGCTGMQLLSYARSVMRE